MSDVKYPLYQSYLVRIWQESAETPPRGSLYSVTDGSTLLFANLEALFSFLLQKAEPNWNQRLQPPLRDLPADAGTHPDGLH